MKKVVFLGDSLTWGGYGGNWVAVVAERLPEVEVVNAGVGGDTVVNLLNRVEQVLDDHSPEVLFVMVGGNDAVSYTMPETRRYYESTKGIPSGIVSPERFESAYRELLMTLRLRFVPTLIGLPPTEYNAELVRVRHLYNAIASRVAGEFDLPVLDLATPFIPLEPIEREAVNLRYIQEIGKRASSGWQAYEQERQKWGYTYTFDGMHLLPETAPRFAEWIVPFVKAHL